MIDALAWMCLGGMVTLAIVAIGRVLWPPRVCVVNWTAPRSIEGTRTNLLVRSEELAWPRGRR